MSDELFVLDTTKEQKQVRDFDESLEKLIGTLGKIDKVSLSKVSDNLKTLEQAGSSNIQNLVKNSQTEFTKLQDILNKSGGNAEWLSDVTRQQAVTLEQLKSNLKKYFLEQDILTGKAQKSLSTQRKANDNLELAEIGMAQTAKLDLISKMQDAQRRADNIFSAAQTSDRMKDAERQALNMSAARKAESDAWDAALAQQTAVYKATLEGQVLLAKRSSSEKIALQKAESDAWDTALAQQTAVYKATLEGQVLLKKLALAEQTALEKVANDAFLTRVRTQVSAATNSSTSPYQTYNPGTGLAGSLKNAEVKALSTEFNILGSEANAAFSGIARGFGLISSSLVNILPMMAGFALSAGALHSLKVGAEFETSMYVIKELAGNSTEEVDALGKALLDLGRTSVYGPLEAAKGIEILTLAGLTLKDAMTALRPTLDFAAAGGVSLDAASATLVAVSTAYGYSAQAFGTVGDVIAKTAAESMASVQGMSESFKAASVVAQLYGVSLSDTAFMLASLSQIGIQGSAAGTSVRNFYTEITKQSGKAYEALKKFNIEVYDSADAGGQLKGTLEIFKQITLATQNLSSKGLQKFFADISNERGGKTATGVTATAEEKIQAELLLQIRKELQITDEKQKLTTAEIAAGYDILITKQKEYASNAAGFSFLARLEKELTVMGTYKGILASLQTDFVEAFNVSSDAVFVLGQTIRSAFNSESFKGAVTSTVSGVVSLVSALTSVIGFVDKYAAAIAAATGAVALIVLTNSALLAGLATSVVAFGEMAAAAISAELALVGITGPLGWIIGAIGLLGAGVYYLAQSWETESEAAARAAAKRNDSVTEAIKVGRLKSEMTSKSIADEIEALTLSNAARKDGALAKEAYDKAFGEAAKSQLYATHDQIAGQIAYNEQLEITGALEVLSRKAGLASISEINIANDTLRASSGRSATALAAENARYQSAKTALDAQIDSLQRLKKEQTAYDERDAKKVARTGTDDNVKAPREKKTPQYSEVTLPTDNSLSQMMQRHKLAYDEINKHENNVESLLKAKEQAHLITEGSYQAELFKSTRQAEEDKLALIERTTDKANVLYQFNKENIISTIAAAEAEGDKGKRKVQQYTAALERLNETKKTADATLDTEKTNLVDKRYTTMELAAIKAQGAIYDLSEAERKYWKADTEALRKAKALDVINDKYRNMNTSVLSLDSASKAGDIASADALEKHAAHIDELTDAYSKAAKSAEDFKAINSDLLKGGDIDAVSYYEGLARRQAALEKAIADGKQKAGASAGEAASIAFDRVRKDQKEKLASDIADGLTEGLFAGGKAGAAYFRKMIIDAVKAPITVSIRAMVTDLITSGGNLLSGANKAFSGENSFLSNLSSMGSAGSKAAEFFGFTGSGVAGLPSAAAATSGGTAYASALAGGATETGALAAANAASGAAAGGGLMGAAATAMPYVAAAIAIYSIASSLDNGGGVPKTEGGYSNLGSPISSYGGNASDLKAKGVVDSMAASYSNLVDLVGAKGSLTGSTWVSTDPNGRSMTQLDVQAAVNGKEVYNRGKTMGGIENVGKSDAELAAALTLSTSTALIEAFKATDLSPALNAYLLPITTAGKSIEELTTVLNNVTATAELTKFLKALPFKYLKDMSVEASVALLKASGGLSNLSTDLSSYYSNFYSASDKSKDSLDFVTSSLKDLGIVMQPLSATTRAWYRSEVERLGAMDLSVEANAKAYASALKLSTAVNALAVDFDATAAATAATAAATAATEKTRQSWQDKLSVLVGIKTSAQVQLETDLASTTDEATKAIIRQVFRQQTLKDAVAAATAAADLAYSALDRAVSAQKTALNAQKATLTTQITASNTLVSTLSSVFTLLTNSIDTLYGTVSTTSTMLVDQARATLTQALASGILPAESVLSAAIATLTNSLSDNNYATAFAKNADTLTLASTLTGIKTLAGTQQTVAQQQLTAAQSAVDLIDAQLTTLDETLVTAKLQLDTLKGIDVSILSVADALKNFAKANSNLGTANTNLTSGSASFISGPGGAVAGPTGKKGDGSGNFYVESADPSGSWQTKVVGSAAIAKYTEIQTQISNRWGDAEAMANYAKDNNLTINDIATASGYMYSDLSKFFGNAGIPRFAAGGDHAGGWRLVGENGPELENTGPSRIYNATMTAAMLTGGSDDSTSEQLASLREDMRAQAGATVRLQASFVKILNRWDANGMPETRVTT